MPVIEFNVSFCVQYWQLLKNQRVAASSYNIDGDFPDDAKFLRDKSASCSHGLEMSPRPTTVIGKSYVPVIVLRVLFHLCLMVIVGD